jgi:hypothetical protein
VADLPGGHGKRRQGRRRRADLAPIEAIAAGVRLVADGAEIGVDEGERAPASVEPFELGVMPVAAGLPGEHGAGEEAFAPEGDESAGVEVSGMEGPESHGSQSILRRSTIDRRKVPDGLAAACHTPTIGRKEAGHRWR